MEAWNSIARSHISEKELDLIIIFDSLLERIGFPRLASNVF
jgi:hypothetical protein